MKKLKLNLDDLKVESFEVSVITTKLGTVLGQLTEETGGDTNCNCPTLNCRLSEGIVGQCTGYPCFD